MNGEPQRELLRLRHVCEWLGVDQQVVESWADAGLLHRLPKDRPPRTKGFFSRTEIAVKILGHPARVEERK